MTWITTVAERPGIPTVTRPNLSRLHFRRISTFPRRREMAVSDFNDRMSNARAERLTALVIELLPAIRELRPRLTEEQLIEAARRMAEYRLIDEGLFSSSYR